MRLLEAKAAEMAQKEKQAPSTSSIMFVRGETTGLAEKNKIVNPDEIDIDDSDEDDDDEAAEEVEIPVEKQAVPAKVFGSLKRPATNEEDEEDD